MLCYVVLPTLQTERLILRPVTLLDAGAIFEYAKDPEVSKLLAWYPHSSIDETKKLIKKWLHCYEIHMQAPWGIVDKKSGNVIGTIEARNFEKRTHFVEIGYCLSRTYWGQGYMKEVVETVLDYLFNQMNVSKVIAFVRNDNIASQRVLEKTGFIIDKVNAKQELMKGKLIGLDRWVKEKLLI